MLAINNVAIPVTVGFDKAGRPREIFVTNGKSGSGMDALLGDVAVIVSIALQSGIAPHDLAKSIARVPDLINGPSTNPASPVGAILDLLCEYGGMA